MATTQDTPIRSGLFETVEEASDVLRELRQAGFTEAELSVVTSDPEKAEVFHQLIHESPAGKNVNAAMTAAGAVGAGLGGAALITALVASAGTAVFVAGAFAGLAAVGTFASIMATRGTEKELADYYDQAVTHGHILVAVDTEDVQRQQLAEKIIAKHQPEQIGRLPHETAL